MRELNTVVVHCSATSPDMDWSVDDIRAAHKARGWTDVGYHYVIRRDGTLEEGRSLRYMGAHVKGHNEDSIGVCLIGGIDKNGDPDFNYTLPQIRCLDSLLAYLVERYEVKVKGHRDLDEHGKACPCFDVHSFFYGGAP